MVSVFKVTGLSGVCFWLQVSVVSVFKGFHCFYYIMRGYFQ